MMRNFNETLNEGSVVLVEEGKKGNPIAFTFEGKVNMQKLLPLLTKEIIFCVKQRI